MITVIQNTVATLEVEFCNSDIDIWWCRNDLSNVFLSGHIGESLVTRRQASVSVSSSCIYLYISVSHTCFILLYNIQHIHDIILQ